jgi:hypothetical protein
MTCEKCNGTGRVENPPDPPHPPTFKRCSCMLKQDILKNVERGMKGLKDQPVLSKPSPLLGREGDSLLVTAGHSFLSHLRHVAVRQSPTWNFKVTSDAELVTAWLGSIGLKGKDILDPDAYMVSTKYITIVDLVEPPELLVIRMGVKIARNQAASEVLAEAVNTRIHSMKPTWIWDEPNHPLNPGHMFWSDQLGWSLEENFERISGLEEVNPSKKKGSAVKHISLGGAGTSGSTPKKRRKSLRGGD